MGMIGYFKAATPNELAALLDDPSSADTYIESAVSAHRLMDIDKSWHGIHFILTGENMDMGMGGEPPACLVIMGGRLVHDGPVRYLSAVEVAEIAAFVERFTPEQFRSQFDEVASTANAMNVWRGDDPAELVKPFVEDYSSLRTYYIEAGKVGSAMLCWIA
jgi:Domain of unknown function (DUF1877)